MDEDDIAALQYEREKAQRALAVELTRLYESRATWSLEDSNAALTACKNAANCGLDNEKSAIPGLNGPILVKGLIEEVQTFQREEAKKRVYAKANQKKLMLEKRLEKRRELGRELKACRRKLKNLQSMKFEEVRTIYYYTQECNI